MVRARWGVVPAVSSMAVAGCLFGGAVGPPPPGKGSASAKATTAPAAPKVELPPLTIGSTFMVDPEEPLPKGAVARCGTLRMRAHRSEQVAVSNAGAVFAVDTLDYSSWLRDVTRGQDIARIPNDGYMAAIAPDASFAVDVTGNKKKLKFYALPSGAVLGEVDAPLPEAAVSDIDRVIFSPDSAAAATITTSGVSHFVDVASHTLRKTVTLPKKTRLRDLSRKGERALLRHVHQDDGRFEGILGTANILSLGFSVIDVATGKVLRKVDYRPAPRGPGDSSAPSTPQHGYAQLRLSPDGTRVLRYEEGTLVAIDVATGKESTIYTPKEPRSAPPMDAAHDYGLGRAADAFAVFDNDHVRLGDEIVDLQSKKAVTRLGKGFVAMSPNGEHQLTKHGMVFELAGGSRGVRAGHDGPVTGLAFLPDGRLVTTGSGAKIWKTEGCTVSEELGGDLGNVATATKKPATLLWAKGSLFLDESGRVTDVPGADEARLAAVSADASRVFFASGDPKSGSGWLRAADPHAGVRTTREIYSPIRGLSASPDGQALAFVEGFPDYDKPARIHLVSPTDLKTSAAVEVPRTAAGRLAFAGPGLLLHAPGLEAIYVHEVPSLRPLRKVGPGLCCSVIAGSPDGKHAAGAYEKRLYVWDLATRAQIVTLESPQREPILSMAFSPDGRVLATGSADSTVLLWDVEALARGAEATDMPSKATTRIPDPAAAKAFFDSTSETYVVKADGTLALSEPDDKDPPRVPALSGVTRVAGTYDHFCAIAAGEVRCWGSTSNGVLGLPEQKDKDGKPVSVWEPTTIAVKGAVDVKVGWASACALTRTGDLMCWGRLSEGGKIEPPTKIQGDVASFVFSPYNHLCRVAKDGAARCQRDERLEDVAVKDVAAIAPEGKYTCVLQRSGGVECYGENYADQLGDDTGLDSDSPVVVKDLPPATAIGTSGATSCALVEGAKVYCWGGLWEPSLRRPVHLAALDGSAALRVIRARKVCGLREGHADCMDFTPKE